MHYTEYRFITVVCMFIKWLLRYVLLELTRNTCLSDAVCLNQIYTSDHIQFLLKLSVEVSTIVRPSFFPIILSVSKTNAKVVAPHFKELQNDTKYKKETQMLRLIIVGTVASASKVTIQPVR